ncbi:uncharacterized protein [Salminus brasiliensis]|uniref:uncharacterized protein n=1 Tax=Salminus brasiliensis TaxID=930266 RepID=UPI003B835F2A
MISVAVHSEELCNNKAPLLGSSDDQESEDEPLVTPPPPGKKRIRKQQGRSSRKPGDEITSVGDRKTLWRRGCLKQAKRPQMSPRQDTESDEEKEKPKRDCEAKRANSHRSVSTVASYSEPQSGISKTLQKKKSRPNKRNPEQDVLERSDKESKTDSTKKRDTRKQQNNKHISTETASVPALRGKKTPTSKTSKSRCSTTPALTASSDHSLSDLEDTAGRQETKNSYQLYGSSPDLEDDGSRGSSKSEHLDELVEDSDDEAELSSLKHNSKRFRHKRSKHSTEDLFSSSELEDVEKQPVKRRIKKTPKRWRGASADSDLLEWPMDASSARPLAKTKVKGESKRRQTGPIECKVCGRLIRCQAVMKRHMLTHTGEKPFECDDCGRRYTSSSNLRIHQQSHTGKMDFSCEECGHKFTHLPYLKRHLLRHSGNRQHMCDQCGKGFIQKYHLERHLLVHSGKMPYACDQCDASFNRTDYLSLHMRNVHLSEGNEKEIKAKPSKPFKCNVCEKAFITRTSLEVHIRVHTGVTPFTCSICQRKFKQSSQMNAHMRTHSGEKPHACDVCGIKFSRKYHVRIHKEKKHLAKNSFQQSSVPVLHH